MKEKLNSIYGGKTRIRVCGICIENDSLLMIRHEGVGEQNILWIPPGGGMEFGEDAHQALKREFLEETGLNIEVNELLFVNEYIDDNLHAVELFFSVAILSGYLQKGSDPEMDSASQIIKEVRFVSFEEMRLMNRKILHNSLRDISDKDSLLNMRGYFKFCQ